MRHPAIVIAFVGLVVSAGFAQTPLSAAFNYQGRLNQSGQPLNGSANFVFKLYNAGAGGSLLGTQTINGVAINSGLFTVALNGSGQFGSSAFNGERRWLEISVNGTPLTPRQELAAAPYSLQTRGLRVDDVGRVGVGTTNPTRQFTVHGGLHLSDVLDEDVLFDTSNFYVRNGDTLNAAYHYQSDPEQHEFSVGGALSLKIASNGNVGVRVASPVAALDVGGTTKVSANSGVGLDASNASTAAGATAIRGTQTGATGTTYGVFGVANSTSGTGVLGRAAAVSGATVGVFGTSDSPSGYGVYGQSADNIAVRGEATASSGVNYGVYGDTASTSGRGVYARATASTGATYGLYSLNSSDAGVAVYSSTSSNTGATYGVFATNASNAGTGVFGRTTTTTGDTIGVHGECRSNSGWGVLGEATATTGQAVGVRGVTASNGGWGVSAFASSPTGTTYGLRAQSNSSAGHGVFGFAPSLTGVTYGVYGEAWSDNGFGVYSDGDFAASGTKAFRIDHPDDPANKYLMHYAAESPEVINFYRGTVVLDAAGEAVVELPHYFAKINKTPGYQLTAIGAPMPQLHVAEEISDAAMLAGEASNPGEPAPLCTFRIGGGKAGGKVSWRVESVRNDVRMRATGAAVERLKKGAERGKYQHPELYGQPPEKGMNYDAERERPPQ